MDLIVLLGIVGSVASIVGVYLAAPNVRSRVIHGLYGLLVTGLAGGLVYYWLQASEFKHFETQAKRILQDTTDADERAMMLAALALLEGNKHHFPDTYSAARELCIQAGLLGSQPTDSKISQYDGARAMRGLLQGLGGAR